MRARVCPNPTCGWVIPPGDGSCLLCGTPAPPESPEEAALHVWGPNERWAASDVTQSRSVLHLHFKSRRPARLSPEE